MIRVMVVGAAGVLGQFVCTELIRIFDNQLQLIVTDYKAERGKKLAKSLNKYTQFQNLDVNDKNHIQQVIKDVDVVIVVLKQQEPLIQKACIENKILCIDVTPFYDFVEKVIELNQIAEENNISSVVMSGFFPGLSGFMIKEAISNFQEVSEVHVSLLQNTNAQAGVTGIFDMLKIISQPVVYKNKRLSGFSQKRNMHFVNLSKSKKVRFIHHAEKICINQKLTPVPIYYWTSWNSNAFNHLVSLIKKTGLIKMLHKIDPGLLSKVVKHDPNKNENAYLTVEVQGSVQHKKLTRTLSLSTFSDYHTTAMVTAALAKITLKKGVKGVVYPFEMTDLKELLSVINCTDLILEDIMHEK